jgi:hypothetical protein
MPLEGHPLAATAARLALRAGPFYVLQVADSILQARRIFFLGILPISAAAL